jgi:hypothetical protein
MNISIPADLKQRMDAATEPTNWSAIACDAFRVHLHKLAAKKPKVNMETTIERLKASKETSDNAALSEGEKDGRDWAARYAEAIQLQRLEEASDPIHSWGFGRGDSAYSDAEHFYFIIEPDDDGDRSAAQDFWDSRLDEMPDTAYVEGFATGAMGLWAEVKGKL